MSNAAGFQYFGGTYVTVLSSKTSQRYRLQSDNLACLWILTESLQSRLAKRLANEKAPLECSYSSSLPMHEYYSEIELHFHKRKKLMALQEQLEQRSAQFRAIQKRLLSRFKDKTPTPLTNLDSLLEGIGFFYWSFTNRTLLFYTALTFSRPTMQGYVVTHQMAT